MKTKTLKLISKALIVIILVTSFLVGCNVQGENADPHIVDEMFAKLNNASNTKNKFVSDLYVQAAISWKFDLEVIIENGKVFFNGVEYDDISCVNTCNFTFTNLVIATEEEIETVNKLQKSPKWYILKTNQENKIADKIAMCEIDNAYYFLSIVDNQVIRIHKFDIV